MDPTLFLRDLEQKPASLLALAETLDAGDPFAGLTPYPRRVLILGMGSSRYAARVAALRLRAAGIDAWAEYSSAGASLPPRPDTLVVTISASGGSRETVEATARYRGISPIVALTNADGAPIAEGAALTVPMLAGVERGGVACRSFTHTLALLLTLAGRLTGGDRSKPVAELCRRAAEATAHLLDDRRSWLPAALEVLDGPDGVHTIAPAERISSAEQSALMVREGPRRRADATETGDWAHVDVYLTKTLDYRALLFPGSRYDEQAMEWIRQRGSRLLAVGAPVAGAAAVIRYPHDDDPDVRLLTETLIAELVAATWWADPPTA
ncbi:SIS domain-containing protein [Actinoplanes sp. L3-i22]|uniref:SIS domain-containing protein n=1 Tax=Actinoplanes sp. L3-i22 TaxID=2836373 RepID=UPI001C75987D|nr:SIS domain-containing protein [Actinoplanes sp. L3-i22]BCY10538.1 sigma factor regulator FecR [Actinoplanes sp. L3-i22]